MTVQMKNWLPLVLGPAFAMLRIPGPVCFTANAKTKKSKPLIPQRRDDIFKENQIISLSIILTGEVFIFELGTVNTNTSSTL